VFLNLFLNARDAMPSGGWLSVATRLDGDRVVVAVRDTGIGLPPKQADQIFDAFFTTKDHGTGMGLAISRSIVEAHGGRLWAADNRPRGATFSFALPSVVDGSTARVAAPIGEELTAQSARGF
jgi:signal transduction histidine kinase